MSAAKFKFSHRDLPDSVVELFVVVRLDLLLPLPVGVREGPEWVPRVHFGLEERGGHRL